VCVCVRARRVFGKLPPQPVECKDGSTATGVRGGMEMTGGMDGRLVAVRWWRRRDDEKKRKRPRSHGSVSGAPVSVCVCVRVYLSGVVSGGASVCEGRGQGIPYLFFFSLLFSFSRRRRRRNHRTPTTPDDDTEHLLAAFSLSRPSQRTKGTPPPRRVNRGGEKSSRDDTYFSYIIFSFPLVAVIQRRTVF
jgi:hypothetical protein